FSFEQNPTHEFSSAGTRPVTLQVSNNSGLASSITRTVTVTAPVITLSAVGSRVKGQRVVDLSWSGASSAAVDVYRNTSYLLTTSNDGAERTTVSANGTYSYKVCQSIYCSNAVTVTF
ncbi:MAG TPA: peptidase S8, partial [Myxococcales bacterium]|nr:peptidase S8 [Myxococcales bacterium]